MLNRPGSKFLSRANLLLSVRRARDLGFTLGEVREQLSLADEPGRPCADVEALARAHLVQVEAKIEQLDALTRGVTGA